MKAIFEEILQYVLATAPVRATGAGLHTYDHQLDIAAQEYRHERAKQLREYVEQLSALDSHDLVLADQIDRQILIGHLEAEAMFDADFSRWERDPSLPLELLLYGCLSLISREFAPLEQRLDSLIGRLNSTSRLLDEFKANLQDQEAVPTVWAEMGEDLCRSALAFIGGTIAPLAARHPAQALEIQRAVVEAYGAIEDYQQFIQGQLTHRSRGAYAIGRERFEAMLRGVHQIELSASELEEIGREEISETEKLISETCRRLGGSPRELIAELKSTPPANSDVLKANQAYVARAVSFLQERDLLTLPDGAMLEVKPTPEFVRHTYPYAAYAAPAPLGDGTVGEFWVTPIEETDDEEARAQQLRNHNRYQGELIALHEGYPGHHVQLTLAYGHPSRVRRIFETSVFVEGWALYCEELMWEQGFFPDERYRLMQLYLQLWRACRIVIDVGIHCGTMSFTDAVNLLVEVAQLDKMAAIAEVKRYTQSPTQPMSYLVGKKQILALRREMEKRNPARFTLKRFHDQLLAQGSIPIASLRRVLTEQMLPGAV